MGVDRFGNLMTNIERRHLDQLRRHWPAVELMTVVGRHRIVGFSSHYAEGASNTALALIGSRDCLEIAVNCGSAANLFQASRGDAVRVRPIT